MKNTTTSILAALALVTTLAVAEPQAADFWIIIANLNDTRTPHAQVDASIDTRVLAGGPVPVVFDVFRADGSIRTSFGVEANQNGFASSAAAPYPDDNLFTASAGLPVLVRVRTPQVATSSAAILRQTLARSAIVFDVPQERRQDGTPTAVGRLFSVPVGEIAVGTTLLIANVSGADVVTDVFVGTPGALGTGKYNVGQLHNRGIWIVALDQSDANSHMVIVSTGEIVVQLAVDDGKKSISESAVLPR